METTDNNILIAEFMGIDYNPEGERKYNKETGAWTYTNVFYHTSWDWLMPVMDKIETLGYSVNITSKTVAIMQGHGAVYATNVYISDGLTKIKAAYETVVEFIKWHNEHNIKKP